MRAGGVNPPSAMLDPRDNIIFDEIDKDGPQDYSGTYAIAAPDLNRYELVNLGPVSINASAAKGDLPGEYAVDGSTRLKS